MYFSTRVGSNLLVMRVYVSGAISNRIRANRVRVFAEAAQRLRARGYDAVDPFSQQPSVDGGLGRKAFWRAAMRADLRRLVTCDSIYMIRGWRNSKGSRLERSIAQRLGMHIMYETRAQWKRRGRGRRER